MRSRLGNGLGQPVLVKRGFNARIVLIGNTIRIKVVPKFGVSNASRTERRNGRAETAGPQYHRYAILVSERNVISETVWDETAIHR